MTVYQLNQRELERSLRARLAAGGIVAPSLPELEANVAERALDPQRLQAVVVIERFELRAFVRGSLRFAQALSHAQRTAWHREFTRTVFLLGSPNRLKDRFAFAHTAEGAGIGWVAPKPAQEQLNLTRLLKPLRTARPAHGWVDTLINGSTAAARELQLVTHGLRLEELLVHLNHLLADSLIEGSLSAEETLRLQPVASIDTVRRGASLRITRAARGEPGLVAFAALEAELVPTRSAAVVSNLAGEA
jgi:hypothetical protein